MRLGENAASLLDSDDVKLPHRVLPGIKTMAGESDANWNSRLRKRDLRHYEESVQNVGGRA